MTIQAAAMRVQSRVYSAFVRDGASGQIIPELIIRISNDYSRRRIGLIPH